MSDKKECPCYSGERYAHCCRPYHTKQKMPPTPAYLMRSRYAAYALHDVQYIIQTTHPQSPFYQINKKQWQEELLAFCKNTKFEGLNILQETETTVTFHAQLTQQGEDASFLERSQFELYQGKWMYVRPF